MKHFCLCVRSFITIIKWLADIIAGIYFIDASQLYSEEAVITEEQIPT